jgi:hypothetical protein
MEVNVKINVRYRSFPRRRGCVDLNKLRERKKFGKKKILWPIFCKCCNLVAVLAMWKWIKSKID